VTAAVPLSLGARRNNLVLAIIAGGAITSIGLGIRYSFGLFLDPVIETLGTDRGAFALVIAVQNIVWGVSQPVAGAIADRFGTGKVLAAGGLAFAAAMLLMSTAETTELLMLSAGFLTGVAVAAASFTVVLSAVGRMAPVGRRSMALGVVSAAGSVGQFVLIPITRRLIDANDWQFAAVVLAFIALAIAVFAPVLRGSAIEQQTEAERSASGEGNPLSIDLRRAAASRSYLLLNLGFFVCGFHVVFIGTHLASYAGDVGVSDGAAAAALALIGLFNIFGSLLAGWLGDRHSKTKLLAGIYALRGVFIIGYILVPVSATTTVIFGATIGLLWLSTVPLTGGIVNQMFGTRNAGALFGIVFFSHQMGAFLGAWLGGEIADRTGSYNGAWWVAVGLAVMATMCHLFIDDGPAPDAVEPAAYRLAPTGGVAAL
jgi:predicted MFS family arabinose efflux permease